MLTRTRPPADTPPESSELPPAAVVSCHGGCGATTVARLLGVREIQRDALGIGDDPLILVARGTAYGMHWATRGVTYAHEYIDHHLLTHPPLLVLVADSPLREPPTVRARLRLVQDRIHAVVRVPYVAAWRDTDDPMTVEPGKTLIEAMAKLQAAVRRSA